MSDEFRVVIPWAGKPKARPRFNHYTKQVHMPPEYTDWKKQVAEYLATIRHGGFDGNVKMQVSFDSDEVHVIFAAIPSAMSRAKGVTADLDNLVGGIMDAAQDAGVIQNDSQVTAIEAWIVADSESNDG